MISRADTPIPCLILIETTPKTTTDSMATTLIIHTITTTPDTGTTHQGDVMATYEHTGPLIAPPPAIALKLGVIIRT